MKYLRKFQTNAQYSAATLYTPSVSLITEKTDLKFKPIVRLENLSISGNTDVLDSEVFTAVYSPIDSDPVYEDITWSIVSGDEYATIDSETGELTVLSGAKNNEVVIRVSSNLLLNIYCEKTISVTSNIMPEYIKDGLIFEVDGTDKQASGNYVWVDKVGGIKFINKGNVVEIDKGFKFNGTNTSLLEGNSTLSISNPSQCTMEIVLKSNLPKGKWAPLFMPTNWTSISVPNALSVYYQSEVTTHSIKHAKSKDYNNYGFAIPLDTICSVHCCGASYIYLNKNKDTQKTSSSGLGAGSNRDYARIGGRIDSGNIVTFTGEIYAIRVYNRNLTEEEILHNQEIDIQKYGINI